MVKLRGVMILLEGLRLELVVRKIIEYVGGKTKLLIQEKSFIVIMLYVHLREPVGQKYMHEIFIVFLNLYFASFNH